MKKIILTILLVLFYGVLFCQTLETQDCAINYRKPAMIKLGDGVKTYSIQSSVSNHAGLTQNWDNMQIGYLKNNDQLLNGNRTKLDWYKDVKHYENKYFTINGLKKVETSGDINISIVFYRVNITTVYTDLQNTYTYSCKVNLKISKKNEDVLLEKDIILDNENFVHTQRHQSSYTAFNDRYFIFDKLSTEAYTRGLQYIDGFSEKSMNQKFSIYSFSHKTYDYKEINAAKNLLHQSILQYNNNINLANVPSNIKKSIDIFEKALLEYDAKNKEAKINDKVADGLYANCTIAYWLLSDFENAKKYCNLIKTEKKVIKAFSKIKKNIEDDAIRAKN